MLKGFIRRWPIMLGAAMLMVGGTTLGVLQVQWARSAARAEMERLHGSLARGIRQAASDAEDEIRVIESLMLNAAAHSSAQNWSRLTASLKLWESNTRFPELLRSLYIVQRRGVAQVLEYSCSESRLIPAALPVDIQGVLQGMLTSGRDPLQRQTAVLPGRRRIIMVPALGSELSLRASPLAAILIVLDIQVFYGRVLPRLVAIDLGEYPYRIVMADTGAVIEQAAGLTAGREPDAIVRVSTDPFGGMSIPRTPMSEPPPGGRPLPQGFSGAAFDPLLQAWLQRAQGNASIRPALPEASAEPEATLQVFYPKASIDATARMRQSLNVGLSLSILSILLASVFVLIRLYGRSLALRAREQEFVASISHELRTPLSVIQATSQNLARGVVSAPCRQRRYAEVILDQVRRLSSMLESVLMYAGLQSAKLRPPASTEFDAGELIREILQPFLHLASERGSTLKLDLANAPVRLRSDRMALGIILENLVMNAIRHADPGEIRVRVARDKAKTLSIAVEDDGPGIPPREQARVFEPFVRCERSMREQTPGSGLGLNLVQRVVTILGGTVCLRSPYPVAGSVSRRGCRFVVTLPFEGDHYHA